MDETQTPEPERRPDGLGHRLQRARDARNLDQQAAASASGLPLRAVRALEAEDYASLEAPVYVRGYLRKYADWLGLPAEELVDLYEQTASVAEPRVRARFSDQPLRGDSPRWLVPASLAVGFVVAGLLAFFGWRHFHRSDLLTQIPPTAVSAAIASSASLPNAAGSGTRATGGSSSGQKNTGVPATSSASDAQVVAVPSLRLGLKVKQPSWVEVKNATTKKRLYYNLAAPGSDLHFNVVGGRVVVFLGNASGVTVTVNGQPYAIPSTDYRGKTARFLVGSRAPLAATAAAH